jgi:dTDP-4-amino-4,6-dideoxygalactose transaminase
VSPKALRACINERTRAIVPIDYAGHPYDIDEVNAIAREHNLIVVHDAAQSCGSSWKGVRIGSQSPITCFSFHATKNLVTGEGGCLVTNDDAVAERVRVMREKGTSRNAVVDGRKHRGYWAYEHESKGNSYVQSDILGALALSQLKKLDWMNAQRAKHSAYLNDRLAGISGLQLPYVAVGVESNWHIYAVRVPAERLLWIKEALNAEGIGCDMHYRPLHQHSHYRSMGTDDDFPEATRVAQTLLRLPMYPGLTKEELDDIIAAVRKVFAQL